ncbi:MAG: hypothetical protein ABIJ57_13365 [Pseudomonadota bacterium]
MPDEPVGTQAPVEAPPEPPVATAPDIPEGQVDTAPDPAALKAEIERLQEARKKAEEDARYWRQEKARSRADYFKDRREPDKPPPAEPQVMGEPPRKEDFDDYEKYLDAKVSYEANKRILTWNKEQARKSQETEHQLKMTRLREKIDLGFSEYPDFQEVAMDEMVPITPMVMEALAEFQNPHKLAYYLGKNRAEAIQIARMTPVAAARALARIEIEIEKAGPGPGPKPSTVTGAPPPIKPSGSSHVVTKDPEKMSQVEYEEWRKNQGARRY